MPLDVQSLRQRRPSNPIYYFETVGSTMLEALMLLQKGSPPGTVILADEQTSGIGRLGRSWYSEAETGIYCSLLLRLPLPPEKAPLANLLLGLATAEGIQKATDLRCDLRWPNDVLINGYKAAGIIAQLTGKDIIAGIGINVNQTRMPQDLRTPGTSLTIQSGGRTISREDVLVELLEAVDQFTGLLEADGPDAVLRAFASASSYVSGRRVIIEETGRRGTTAGLDPEGHLLVQYDAGTTERVATGGVRAEV